MVLKVDEASASNTAAWTGEIKDIGGARFLTRGGIRFERDITGGRGICLRALADRPETLPC